MVRYGATRLVILWGPYAYKIARIRPLKTVLKLVAICLIKRHRVRFFTKYHNHFLKAVWRYIFAGLYANWSEYQYWNRTHSKSCAPIERMFLKGLVVKQVRVESITDEEFKAADMSDFSHDSELVGKHQYGLLHGRCVQVDYAHFLMWEH